MPELPEVQTIVDDLNAAGLNGIAITGARVFWPRTISELTPAAFCRKIKNQKTVRIWRRGKFIVFDLTGPSHLLIHLRMTGRLLLTATGRRRSKHEHVILTFDDQRQLRFHDTRKFGRFYLVPDAESVLNRLGPEPLAPDFNVRALTKRLQASGRCIKPLLLDQSFLAGLGNIYADEALWEARIHPLRTASSLSGKETRVLHRAIVNVLKNGLKNLGTTLGSGKANFYSIASNTGRNRDRLMVFRRTGLPCPRCADPIERMVVGQRGTHVCPNCQRV